MLNVGLTGGIGSGKTTVAKLFHSLGIPIYYADDSAKRLMVEHLSLKQSIIKLFGEEAYSTSGELNRAYLAQIVFNDESKRKALEHLVHPAVYSDSETWNQTQKEKGHPYSIREAALTFETGSYLMLDKVITIFAPKEIRINRILKRDNSSIKEIEARMDAQWSDELKIEKADFVIYNNQERMLIPQILGIHHKLLVKAKNKMGNK